MLIRREDKKIVYYVALLGAVLSVYFAHSALDKLRKSNYSQSSTQDQSVLQVGAMDKLRQSADLSAQMAMIESVTSQLTAVNKQDTIKPSAQVNFCTSLVGWQVVALMVGVGVVGYGIIFVTMWIGVILLYILIRAVYSIIRRVQPNCAAAARPTFIQEGKVTYLRNPDRILPLAIKLIVLMKLTLALLIVIVWHWTSLGI